MAATPTWDETTELETPTWQNTKGIEDFKKDTETAQREAAAQLRNAQLFGAGEVLSRAGNVMQPLRTGFNYLQGVGKQAVDSALGYGEAGDFARALSGEPVKGAWTSQTNLGVEVPAATPEDFQATYGVPKGAAEVMSGLSQGAADLVNFMQTPEGIALWQAAKLPPTARAVAAPAISAEIASQSPQVIQEFQEAKARGDKAGMSKAVFNGLVTAAGTGGVMKLGAPEVKPVPAIPETPLRSHAATIEQMRLAEEAARQAEAGSPFTMARQPVEPANIGLPEAPLVPGQTIERGGGGGVPTIAGANLPRLTTPETVRAPLPGSIAEIAEQLRGDVTPAGERVFPASQGQVPVNPLLSAAEAAATLGEVQPPAPTMAPAYQSGRAAQVLRERAAAEQRAGQFEAARAEKTAQEQVGAIHPDKPLTPNQLRLVQESLAKAIGATIGKELPAEAKAAAPKASPTVPPETVRGKATRVDILGDPVLDIVDEFKQKPAQSGPFTPEQLDAVLRKGWQWLKENPPELEKVLAATGKTADQLREALSRPELRPKDTPIKIQQPDGTIINAVTDGKTWEGGVPNVGRAVEMDGKFHWSDGPLRPGEKIVETKGVGETVGKPQVPNSFDIEMQRRMDAAVEYMQKERTRLKYSSTYDTNFAPAVELENGKVVPGKTHFALRKEGWKGRFGYVDETGKFYTMTEAARKIQSQPEKALIAGSALEKWANEKLKGKLLSPTPEDMAALAVKGAAQLERGVTDFARWSKAMTDAHGPAIKPQLKQIYEQSKAIRAGAFNVKPSTENQGAATATEASSLTGGEPSPAVTPPTRTGTASGLEDVYRIFEPPEKTKTGIGQAVSNVIESVRTGLSSKFRPLDKLAEDIAKAYGTVSKKGIAGIFEQLKGSRGRGEADIIRFDRDVSSLVKGSEKDFNAYMFLRRSLDRLQQDLADGEGRRKVAGYDTETLQAKLATLTAQLGAEKLGKFRQAADLYQQHMDKALKLQVESGRMSQEVYDAIKNGNQFYAPFKVMKYIEETSRPEGTGKRVDTLADFTKAMKGIEDPNFRLGDMLGAARQSLLLSRILADKNNVMRKVADMAKDDTEGRFIRKLVGEQEPPHGWETVNVLENGKPTKYATNPDVARALQAFGDAGSGIISKTLSLFSIPFRAGATALNLPFQISNLMADVPRQALVSKYGIGFNNFLRYPFDLAHALLSSVAGDVAGKPNKLFMDFLDSGVAGVTVQEHLTPKALRTETVSTARKVGEKVLWAIPDFAAAIEQTSKVLGVKNAMKAHGVKSGAELAAKFPEAITELRRFSGSPDFGRQGMWTETARLNLLYMFFNARLQGTIADVGRLAGRDGAGTSAKTWFKVGTAVGLPTAYLYSLNNSEKYKDDYAQRPDQEKRNYWLIPKDTFITNEQGEKMRDYWRIPKRESAKWVANLTESALDFANQKDPETFAKFSQNMLEDISPVNIQGNTFQERAESVAASLNPVLKAPLEAATGRDMYRHRDIVPDVQKKASPEHQYTDTTAEAFKKLADVMPDVAPEVFRSPLMLENMTKNMTAGLLTQFLKTKPVEGRSDAANQPLLRRFQAVPFTEQTAVREEIQGLQREAADTYLKRHREAQKLVTDGKGKELADILKGQTDPKLIRHTIDLWLANKNGITNTERQVLALPVDQRAKFLSKQLKGMDKAQKEKAILNYAKKRILTEAVAAQMAEDLQ